MDLKDLVIAAGVYRPARVLYRQLNRPQLARFRQGCRFYADLLEPGALCFDVGGKTGEVTEMLLQSGASVVAFEPQADCIRELRARCAHRPDRLTALQTAVGSEIGEATLYVRPFRGSSSLHQDWPGAIEKSTRVPVTTLDAAIAQFGRPSYCKIDVEGWEAEVLRGLSQSIPLVSFEYHLGQSDVARTKSCLDYLSRLGDLRINLTPAENLLFSLPQWLSKDEFLKRFPDEFRKRKDHEYGDIFVRVDKS